MSTPTLSFDGTDDYVTTTAPARFGTSTFSVGGWVKFDTLPNSRHTIVSTYDGSNGSGFILGEVGGEYRLWTSGANNVLGGTPETGVWHHVCGTRDDSGNLTLYVDGEIVGTGTSTTDVTTDYDTEIGREPTGSAYYLSGALDDVRLFNKALSHSDVRSFMDGHTIGSEHAQWSMNEGTGTTLTDASSYNRGGTINGATWSTRSDGNTYNWSSRSGFLNYQSNNDTAVWNSDVIISQENDHLTTSSEEAFYRGYYTSDTSLPYDSSPANNHAIDSSGVGTLVNDKFKGQFNIFSFDSSNNDYIELPSAIHSSTDVLSVEGWFRPQSSGEQTLVDFGSQYRMSFDRDVSQGIDVAGYGDGIDSSVTELPFNTWHHFNFYWDVGNEFGLSVNGGSWDINSSTETVDSYTGGRYIGRNAPTSTNYYTGGMSNIRFVADQKISIENSLYQTDGTLTTGRQT